MPDCTSAACSVWEAGTKYVGEMDFGAPTSGRFHQPVQFRRSLECRSSDEWGWPQLPGGGALSIRKIAVCAGAGGSVFEKLSGYDLYFTGEMRHHDVVSRASSGSSVILCEHTHTERGYLRVLGQRLASETSSAVVFHLSQRDRDPLSWA